MVFIFTNDLMHVINFFKDVKDVSPLYKPEKFIEYQIRLYKRDPDAKDEALKRFVMIMRCK